MARPLVIAHHLIWTVYGTWLPNDPRGSTSEKLNAQKYADLGAAHFGRKRVQPKWDAVRDFYREADDRLSYPKQLLSTDAIEVVAEAFDEVRLQHRYTIYACAILPDHVHLVIRKHKDSAECMMRRLKEQACAGLAAAELFADQHPVWTAGDGWKVYLDHPDAVRRTIAYVQKNPSKSRMPSQDWPFVSEYDGWPLHPGHSPNSPYARRAACGRAVSELICKR